jgi:hypothetical protein
VTTTSTECRIVSGGALVSTVDNALALRKPGKVVLLCPFEQAVHGYDLYYYDGDGTLGGQSLKVTAQVVGYEPRTLRKTGSGPFACDFRSNFTTGAPNGPATVPECVVRTDIYPPTVVAWFNSFQVELWANVTHPDVRFIGIVTHFAGH